MGGRIQIRYDTHIHGYIVQCHETIELSSLQQAKKEFSQMLQSDAKQNFSLLLDVGSHDFATLDALKYMREFLSIPELGKGCCRFASVAPEAYSVQEIKSDSEAIFNLYADAYEWLLQAV